MSLGCRAQSFRIWPQEVRQRRRVGFLGLVYEVVKRVHIDIILRVLVFGVWLAVATLDPNFEQGWSARARCADVLRDSVVLPDSQAGSA